MVESWCDFSRVPSKFQGSPQTQNQPQNDPNVFPAPLDSWTTKHPSNNLPLPILPYL